MRDGKHTAYMLFLSFMGTFFFFLTYRHVEIAFAFSNDDDQSLWWFDFNSHVTQPDHV